MDKPIIENYKHEIYGIDAQYYADLAEWERRSSSIDKWVDKQYEVCKSPTKYYVDIPQFFGESDSQEIPYKNIGEFFTREAAIEFVKIYFGADDQGKISLISTS